ncbi:MAG TPA: hypothetical protein VG944_19230 [Fimbriimonas sp.]|nr:hypothetical protein [Fimbriimonas sp.]
MQAIPPYVGHTWGMHGKLPANAATLPTQDVGQVEDISLPSPCVP